MPSHPNCRKNKRKGEKRKGEARRLKEHAVCSNSCGTFIIRQGISQLDANCTCHPRSTVPALQIHRPPPRVPLLFKEVDIPRHCQT
jgi:hypothetical protein